MTRPLGAIVGLVLVGVLTGAETPNLVKNPRFYDRGTPETVPAHYTLSGDVEWTSCGTTRESTDFGVALRSADDLDKDGKKAGEVRQRVTDFTPGVGKWYRFTVRGLPESGFAVEKGGLFLQVRYFGAKGTNPLDGVTLALDPLIARDRELLEVNGNHGKDGAAVWKSYALEFRLPFAEIDTLDLVVGFRGGKGSGATSAFYVTDFGLVAIPPPVERPQPGKPAPAPDRSGLISLGGRWYYKGDPGVTARPSSLIVNHANADRLFYQDDRLSNPFAENMSAWLRRGNYDIDGKLVTTDRLIPENVVLEFRDGKELIVRTHAIPNHPTAHFPERFGNPNVIMEQRMTVYLPLEPKRAEGAIAMNKTNSNRALPMGPIGVAVNGVPFFNPFDAGQMEAVSIMDRCCGHPAPNNIYHYHKYPVCIKSPFLDDGEGPSPLLGFAMDGFPIYGPYVAAGVMAKNDKSKPLDEFNMRYDEERGWHYHVTPGKFPYIIGGYAGTVDPRNQRRGPPR